MQRASIVIIISLFVLIGFGSPLVISAKMLGYAGECRIWSQKAPKKANLKENVYNTSLNRAIEINNDYFDSAGRDARCDEIDFHVKHGTPTKRLRAWLKSNENKVGQGAGGKYTYGTKVVDFMPGYHGGTTPFFKLAAPVTVDTSRTVHTWIIHNGKRYQLPDDAKYGVGTGIWWHMEEVTTPVAEYISRTYPYGGTAQMEGLYGFTPVFTDQ